MSEELLSNLAELLFTHASAASNDASHQKHLDQIILKFSATELELQTQRTKEEKAAAEAKAAADADKAKKAAADLAEKQVKQTTACIDAFSTALPKLANSIMLANKAFQRGDNFTGGAAMAEIGATLVTMVGKMIGSAAGPLSLAGPVGGLLGALFSVVSLVLGVLGQKQTSIVDDIEKIMRTINAEDKDGKLNASFKNLKDFERELLWSITLREGELSENSEQNNRPGRALPVDIVRQINLIDGPMKQAIGEVESWLLERKNQELEAWPAILERHCSMYLYLIRVLLLYAAAKRGNEIKQVTLVDIPTLGQREAEFLKAVLPAARNRGIFWHTGTVADKDTIGRTVFERAHLYTRDVGVSARGAAWKSLGGEIMALMPSSALAPQLCDASARSGYRPAPHPTAAGAREPTEHEPLPPRGRPRAACHREPPGRSGVTGGSGSTAMSRPPLEVADVVRQHGAAFLQRYGPTLSGEQHRALRAIAVCRTATLRGPYHPV